MILVRRSRQWHTKYWFSRGSHNMLVLYPAARWKQQFVLLLCVILFLNQTCVLWLESKRCQVTSLKKTRAFSVAALLWLMLMAVAWWIVCALCVCGTACYCLPERWRRSVPLNIMTVPFAILGFSRNLKSACWANSVQLSPYFLDLLKWSSTNNQLQNNYQVNYIFYY